MRFSFGFGALIVVLIIGSIVIMVSQFWPRITEDHPAAPASEGVGGGQTPSSTLSDVDDIVLPEADVVRLQADGSLLIAGRAAPGAMVSILSSGVLLRRVRADSDGSWIVLHTLERPGEPLTLTLQAEQAGGAPVASPQEIRLNAPGQ